MGRVPRPGDRQPGGSAHPLRHAGRRRREAGAVLHRRHRVYLPLQPHRQPGCRAADDKVAAGAADRRAGRWTALERTEVDFALQRTDSCQRRFFPAAKIQSMKIDWDVPIRMDDGLELRADVFRPDTSGKFPALLSYGPYGKGLAFHEAYNPPWQITPR